MLWEFISDDGAQIVLLMFGLGSAGWFYHCVLNTFMLVAVVAVVIQNHLRTAGTLHLLVSQRWANWRNRTRVCPRSCHMKTIAEKTENLQVLTLLANGECCRHKVLWKPFLLQPSSATNNFFTSSGPPPALRVSDDNFSMPNVWPQQIFLMN